MKIEIGESLMLSYLKHVKKCIFYQTNWKVSSNWSVNQNTFDKVLSTYTSIIKNPEFSDIFKSELNQLIKQSEIDVIGIDSNNKIYTADIAFHENGLNYGSKIETKNRVFKKLFRSYLTLLAYFPDRKYELIFASPKVHNATEQIILDYFTVLNTNFSNENVTFKYVSNEKFRDEIIVPTIDKTKEDSDTNELFIRAIKLSNLFEMISNEKENNVRKILEMKNESIISEIDVNKVYSSNEKLIFEFVPGDERIFKQELLKTKKARRTWYYSTKSPEVDIWDASKFTIESSLRGNINSTNKVRVWKNTGLLKIKFEIIK
jgi:hypothetical protein